MISLVTGPILGWVDYLVIFLLVIVAIIAIRRV